MITAKEIAEGLEKGGTATDVAVRLPGARLARPGLAAPVEIAEIAAEDPEDLQKDLLKLTGGELGTASSAAAEEVSLATGGTHGAGLSPTSLALAERAPAQGIAFAST